MVATVRTAHVVHVDVADVRAVERTAAEHEGQAALTDPGRQGVLLVRGQHEHAVDVLRGEEAVEPLDLLAGLHQGEHELAGGVADDGRDAPDDAPARR